MMDLYQACFHWSHRRRGSFPNWEPREIHHEAFIAACDIIHKWDPDRRPLPVFLKYHLYDYVHRKYCKMHDVKIVKGKQRGDGSWPARKYVKLRTPIGDDQLRELPSPELVRPDAEFPQSEFLTDREREMMYLIGRGMSKTQSAMAMSVTQGRVSQLLKTIKGFI